MATEDLLRPKNSVIQEEEIKQSPSDSGLKAWQCGEPFQYPLPAPEEDPWKTLLTPILEKDKAQCDAWKDEVQNLLIFASLFSSVVTAFVIETYKGLQQDPSDTMVLLLSQIANNLESPRNSSSELTSTSLPSFSPTPSIVRVNIFLFISLILSLTTVLIGIVSLQWLREHQAYNGTFTPENTFAAVHMRSEALERWHVPEIFSALPLILQSALVLFFIGILDFLQNINTRVVIPVALVIGLTLVFLFLTTVLPTFQAFILQYPKLKVDNDVPAPCPYKSPQSRAFRRFMTSSRLIFFATSLTFSTIYWVFMRLCFLPGQIITSPSCLSVQRSFKRMFQHLIYSLWFPPALFTKLNQHFSTFLRPYEANTGDGFNYMTYRIHEIWSTRSSFDFESAWLTIRDNYFQSTCSQDSWLYRTRLDHQDDGALYDITLGLCKELTKDDVNMNADFESPIFTAYYCAIDLSSLGQLEGVERINAIRTRNGYISTLLGYDQLMPLRQFLNIMQDPFPTLSLLLEENAFVFLRFGYFNLLMVDAPSYRLSQHLAELYFRLLGLLYSQPHLTYLSNDLEDGPPKVPFSADELYIMKIFHDQDQPFTIQWALTLDIYFGAFDHPNSNNVDFKNSFHSHPFIREYIWNFWKEVQSEFTNKNIQSETLNQILRTFNLIDGTLKNLLENKNGPILDCIFYPAALYAQSYRHLLPNQATFNKAINGLIPTLTRCKDIVVSRDSYYRSLFSDNEYDDHQGRMLFSDEWWQVLFSNYVSHPSQ